LRYGDVLFAARLASLASKSINRWRFVQHTGGGCAIYQCVNCHQLWESPTAPGWTDVTGAYQAEWNYCPYCGVKWKGAATEPQEAQLRA
jgi:hypothetical protein